jgi:uncharacterized protein (DUF433 family)
MATTAPIDIGMLISKSPDVYHGRTVIAGTRIPVMIIAGIYKEGLTPEQIAEEKYLTLAQVYAALTYYHANQSAIEKEIEEERLDGIRLEAEWRKMRAEGRA